MGASLQGVFSGVNSWADLENGLSELGADRNVEKGRLFEELTRLYLLTSPIFATKLTDVWHHSNVPINVADELGLQRPEIGVDLVARTKDGNYWAIQCKYHQERSTNVTYDELKTFLSITERRQTYERLSHRLVATSADGVSDRVIQAHPHKIGYLTAADFSVLGPDEFKRFRELLEGETPTFEPYIPKPHQQRAVQNSVKHFRDGGNTKGKLIHPCGAGKSLTAYWISEALSPKTVLIAVPSLSLVRQTLGTWTREALARSHDIEWLAVCSDEQVSRADDPAMRAVDLGIDVTTDPAAVAEFLSKPTDAVKVLMTTYQSGRVVSEGARKAGISFDLGVFDEAHKTVGSEGGLFAHLLSDKNIPIARRVFMTATERQYRGNSDDILSMDDASIYGETFDQLTFKAALELEPPILSDYRIVSIVVTKAEIERLIAEQAFVRTDGKEWSLEGDAPTFASLVALRKSVEKYGISHTVSFHRSIRRAKEFCELNVEASKADSTLGSLHSFHVSGDVNTAKRARILERFVAAKPSLITNARCLTEGVDVPAIDAVLFADPRQSKIDIVQAAGRAMRRFEGKKLGYIIVPVIIDEESGEPSNDAFDQIITVVSALAMEDERIVEEFKSIASGRRSEGRTIVEIDVPEYVRIDFGDLLENIETRIWARLGSSWDEMYNRLITFVEENGHCRVAARHRSEDGFGLGDWVWRQRASKEVIDEDRRHLLEKLPGWSWDPFTDQWETGFSNLLSFCEREGHSRVPQSHKTEEGYSLGSWVAVQRRFKDKLDPARRRRLEALPGWSWDAITDQWEEGFSYLMAFSDREGHALVPNDHKANDGYGLGTWVEHQRANNRKGKLDPDLRRRLEVLPKWSWDPVADRWEEGFLQLKAYSDREGHCRVPQKHLTENGFRLGTWVTVQRTRNSKSRLDLDQRRRLEELPGWSWDARADNWNEMFSNLKYFLEQHGHCNVGGKYKTGDGLRLGQWVGVQRGNKHRMDPDRRLRLEELPDWSWATKAEKLAAIWEEAFSHLKAFADREGHCRVAARYRTEDGYGLGTWVSKQREKMGKLDPDQRRRLEELPGWSWDPFADQWEVGFSYLKAFSDREGHCQVLQNYVTEDGNRLGIWVSVQRSNQDTIDTHRKRRLEELPGWVWWVRNPEAWEEGFLQLKAYSDREGHCRVPLRYKTDDGYRLGVWVATQRANKNSANPDRNRMMDPDRQRRLENLPGWLWKAERSNNR